MIATIGLFLFYTGLSIIILYIFIAQCYIINKMTENKKDMAAMIRVISQQSTTIKGLSAKLGQGVESLGLVVTATTNLLERQDKVESIVKDLIEAHNQNTLSIIDTLNKIHDRNSTHYTH
jgi:peptide subunit release factor RF-3